jgi:hypothetical protein
MATATNGNEPNTQKLAAALREMQPPIGVEGRQPEAPPQEVYDLSTRMLEAAAACRDIAHYSNDFADHLEKASANYVAGMQRLLGRIARK